MVQRCACILLAEHESRHGILPAETIAEALNDSHMPHVDVASVQKNIAKMMSRGSYYRSLEKALGRGTILALGIEMPETV